MTWRLRGNHNNIQISSWLNHFTDEFQAKIYADNIEPNLKQGATLAFAHGLNIHFEMIKPRADLNVCHRR
jgi:ketol-acid reductoisomerase